MFHTRDLTDRVREKIAPAVGVEMAMRYGKPSIRSALERFHAAGVDRIVVFPLYPQYSGAATGSSLDKVYAEAARLWNVPFLQVVPPFYDHPRFIDAYCEVARPVLARVNPEKVLLSFHGLPERQVLRSDPTGRHCLRREDCCNDVVDANRRCYRAQCIATANLIAGRLDIPEEQRVICFQSRLGRTQWLRPYTDKVLADQARGGCRRATILSPAFVADCLETTEELGIRGVATWKENGGDLLELIPALNSSDAWVDALIAIARESSTWLDVDAGRPALAARGQGGAR